MNPNHFLRKAALTLPVLAPLLMSYRAAGTVPVDPATLGAQIVAQGTKNGAVACARCHGFDGAADGSGAFPRLDGQFADYLADQLRAYASGDRKNAIMQPISKGLSDDEIKAVAQYYANARAISIAPSPQSSQLIARGEQLAKAGDSNTGVLACETCHGPNGQGLPPTVPYLAGQYSHYMSLQIQMYRQGFRKSDLMKDIAVSLRDQDVADLAAYFEQVPRPKSK
jgi:cytochrome c553